MALLLLEHLYLFNDLKQVYSRPYRKKTAGTAHLQSMVAHPHVNCDPLLEG